MGPERRAYRGDGGPPTVDALVARFAAEHFGVISAGHLAAFGLSDDQMHRRVRSGRLHRLFPKVYAVGHTALPVRGHWLAAVWACGPNAVLSHRDAACLWGFRENHRPAIEVTTTDRGRKGHGNIDLHRTRRLASEDVTSRDGIPVTSVARTFVDLAAILDEDGLRKALKQAGIKRLLDVRAIEAAIARSPGRRTVALASLVHVPPAPTESELEDAFLALVRRAGLPDPLMNAHVSTGQGVNGWTSSGPSTASPSSSTVASSMTPPTRSRRIACATSRCSSPGCAWPGSRGCG